MELGLWLGSRMLDWHGKGPRFNPRDQEGGGVVHDLVLRATNITENKAEPLSKVEKT